MVCKPIVFFAIVIIVTLSLAPVGCTVKPQVYGTYHGISGASDEASGNLMFSHSF